MGNLSSQCCNWGKEKAQDHTQQEQIDYTTMIKDNEYFYCQDWFGRDQNFSPEKFILSYRNYREDQTRTTSYWRQVDLQSIRHGIVNRKKGESLSVKWKFLIRKGTPCKFIRPVLLDIFKLTFFDCDTQYKTVISIVFKNREVPSNFKHVPLFGLQDEDEDDSVLESIPETDRKLQLFLKCHLLTEVGLHALIRLLWVIRQQHYQLEYNPMILQVAMLLLCFLEEEQAFSVLEFMVQDSIKILLDPDEAKLLRYHIILNENQFNNFTESFFETINLRSKSFNQICQRFKKIGFNHIDFFQDLISSLFLTYVPLNLAIKIFVMYLNEGVKIYYRFSYALIRTLRDDLIHIKYPEAVKQVIRSRMMNLTLDEQDSLIKKAFSLRLAGTSFKERLTNVSKTHSYYLPIPSQNSSIIQSEDVRQLFINKQIIYQRQFETLWDWLPETNKLCDPHLIFATHKDGFSLKNLLRQCHNYERLQFLLLIQTDKNTVIGAYCDEMLTVTNTKYIGSNDTFVFQLKPEKRKFASTGKNNDHLYCSDKFFSFGSDGQIKIRFLFYQREGPAFQLDEDLNKGFTHKSETYGNYRLNGQYATKGQTMYKCLQLEAYALQ